MFTKVPLEQVVVNCSRDGIDHASKAPKSNSDALRLLRHGKTIGAWRSAAICKESDNKVLETWLSIGRNVEGLKFSLNSRDVISTSGRVTESGSCETGETPKWESRGQRFTMR
jgi:hypothetical protein